MPLGQPYHMADCRTQGSLLKMSPLSLEIKPSPLIEILSFPLRGRTSPGQN